MRATRARRAALEAAASSPATPSTFEPECSCELCQAVVALVTEVIHQEAEQHAKMRLMQGAGGPTT